MGKKALWIMDGTASLDDTGVAMRLDIVRGFGELKVLPVDVFEGFESGRVSSPDFGKFFDKHLLLHFEGLHAHQVAAYLLRRWSQLWLNQVLYWVLCDLIVLKGLLGWQEMTGRRSLRD